MADVRHDFVLQLLFQLCDVAFHVDALEAGIDTLIGQIIHAPNVVALEFHLERLRGTVFQDLPFLGAEIPELFVWIEQRIVLIIDRLPA